MKDIGLAPHEIEMILAVFRRIPAIVEVVLYGSRAKGNFQPESDIDLALVGVVDNLQAEAVAEELDELPLPYHFDVKAFAGIRHAPLREHIARVGLTIYRRYPDTSPPTETKPSSQLEGVGTRYIASQKFCPFDRHVTKGNDGLGATAGLSSSASIENTAGQASSGTHE